MKIVSVNGVSVVADPGCGITVRDINVKLRSGEITVLIGPSGGGKTAILNAIAGVTSLTCGDVSFDFQENIDCLKPEQIMGKPAERDVLVSYQPEMPLLPPNLTVESYCNRMGIVVPPLLASNLPEDVIIADLSASGRRCLWVSLVYSRQADLYIYDDPSLGADWKQKRNMAIMFKTQVENKSVLLATSDPLFAAITADKLVYVDNGEVLKYFEFDDSTSMNKSIDDFCLSRVETVLSFLDFQMTG